MKIAKDKLCFTIYSGQRKFVQPYTEEELGFLSCGFDSLLPEAGEFVTNLGMWDNFSEHGMETQKKTRKSIVALINSAKQLLIAIEKDWDILRLNYSYKMPNTKHYLKRGSVGAITLKDGTTGNIYTGTPGRIVFKGGAKEQPIERDIRPYDKLELQNGEIVRIKKVENNVRWRVFLRDLIQFLETLESTEIEVRHHYVE